MGECFDRFPYYPASDGTWLVWDNDAGRPATLGGSIIAGRTQTRAEAAATVLNRIYQRRMDAISRKSSDALLASATSAGPYPFDRRRK